MYVCVYIDIYIYMETHISRGRKGEEGLVRSHFVAMK